jgi:hypothetical protein
VAVEARLDDADLLGEAGGRHRGLALLAQQPDGAGEQPLPGGAPVPAAAGVASVTPAA